MPPAAKTAGAQAAPDETAVVVAAAPIEHTSIAGRNNARDEVTLRFLKWHAHGNTAYQRGQFAGFKLDVAQRLVASGVALLAQTADQQRQANERFMVTK